MDVTLAVVVMYKQVMYQAAVVVADVHPVDTDLVIMIGTKI